MSLRLQTEDMGCVFIKNLLLVSFTEAHRGECQLPASNVTSNSVEVRVRSVHEFTWADLTPDVAAVHDVMVHDVPAADVEVQPWAPAGDGAGSAVIRSAEVRADHEQFWKVEGDGIQVDRLHSGA